MMNGNHFTIFRTVLLSLFLMVLIIKADAQTFVGARAGINYSFLGPGFEGRYGDRAGYTFGLGSQIELLPNFYFIPELNFARKSFIFYEPVYLDNDFIDTDLILGLNYLDIPLHFGYGVFTQEEGSPDMFLLFYSGLQINWLMSQNNRFRVQSGSSSNTMNIGDIDEIRRTSLGIGLGMGVGYNRLYFDARYFFGFTSLFDFDMIDDFTNTITLSVGYRLRTN